MKGRTDQALTLRHPELPQRPRRTEVDLIEEVARMYGYANTCLSALPGEPGALRGQDQGLS